MKWVDASIIYSRNLSTFINLVKLTRNFNRESQRSRTLVGGKLNERGCFFNCILLEETCRGSRIKISREHCGEVIKVTLSVTFWSGCLSLVGVKKRIKFVRNKNPLDRSKVKRLKADSYAICPSSSTHHWMTHYRQIL